MEYHGNVPYCYANAIAMVASADGEQVYPGLVEVLTGVGLGAVRTDGGQTFFSTTPQNVPAGVNKALDLLGFGYTAAAGPDDVPVGELIRAELAEGPIVLGPLDMGHLTYLPWHREVAGSDHYVVAYAVDDEQVYLHCPAGFPCAALGFDDLTEAWLARRIGLAAGPFHRWSGLHRIAEPTATEIRDGAMGHFAECYQGTPSGGAVIRGLAKDLRPGQVPDGVRGFLTAFSLPLGARRALDFAAFFARGGDSTLAEYKHGQARLFGDGLTAANRGDWSTVADRLDELADIEDRLQHAFTGC